MVLSPQRNEHAASQVLNDVHGERVVQNRIRRRWNSQLNRGQAVVTTKRGSVVGRD